MNKSKIFYYLVEGETEKKLVEVLKKENSIRQGRIKVFNVIQNNLKNTFLRTLEEKTTIILIFDTDIKKIDILNKNIIAMKRIKNIKEIIYIPQISKLEDEIIYSTSINKIKELLNSSSDTDFKNDFNRCLNLYDKLLSKNFDINRIWSRNDENVFKKYNNESIKIKINNSK